MKNRIYIITGGSGLLGKEMINHLTSKGAIAINCDINVETDLSLHQIKCDITKDSSIKQAVRMALKEFGKIDGLVNNAYPRSKEMSDSFEEIPMKIWRMGVDWQLNSYVSFLQNVLNIMKNQGSGSVVNIASIYGVVGNDFSIYKGTHMKQSGAYSAIKGGLINLTRFLASYYGKFGIRVNCLSPGGIFDNQEALFVNAYEEKVPMKRMGKPDDIAPAVTFLLSDDAKYITGHNLIVDGGWTAI